MNLYKFHSKSESLDHYEAMGETNPTLFWNKYKDNKGELKKREKYIAADAEYSYYYAKNVLKGAFPAGEAAISKSAEYSYMYAKYALKGPFPEGEAAIATNTDYANWYTRRVLKADFYLDGKLIAKYAP